jgi:hypothetical protein
MDEHTTVRHVRAASARKAYLERNLPVNNAMSSGERDARRELARERVIRTKAARMITDGLTLLESLDNRDGS